MSPSSSPSRSTRIRPRVGDGADRGAADLPLLADLQDGRQLVRLDHAQHPLLGLADHHLEGLHVSLPQRNRGDVDVDADATLGGHLRGGGGETRRAEVLEGDQQSALEQLERALQQLLLLERIPDLHGGPLVVVLAQLGRGEHGGSPDPVAPGRRAEQHDQVARPRGGGAHELLARGEAESHRVDEAVLLVGALEVDLAAHGRHADRVAVVADPGDGAVEQITGAVVRIGRISRLAEAQRVEYGDRPGADREDVTQDPPDPRGGALEGLDGAGMVVGLDLEGAHEPAADVDGAGVLAGTHHDMLALGGQGSQQLLGVLVGAVLAPQQRVHGQLNLVRWPAALLLADQLVLGRGQAEGDRVGHAGGRGGLVHAAAPILEAAVSAIERNRHRPSVEPPVSSCTACSGWGISPITLPSSLVTPAMSRREPLKFSPGA